MNQVKKLGKYGWLISLLVLFIVNSFITGYADSINKSIRRTHVLGQEDVVPNESALAVAAKLPLVRIVAKDNVLTEEDIDDSLFYARKEKEVEKVYVAPVVSEIKTDVSAEIKRQFTLVSTMKNGAVINGRFYSVGAFLKPFRLKNIKGEMVLPKLVRVGRNSVVIDVDGIHQTLSF